ncbi:MAG TPA: MoxR family ATPase [Planctomycetota bacterium]|nr:MoxR family ATPase [Planctomycetota bacterium]
MTTSGSPTPGSPNSTVRSTPGGGVPPTGNAGRADLVDALLSGAGGAGGQSPLPEGRLGQLRLNLRRLSDNIEQVLLGKTRAVRQVIAALIARGHILIQDVPGVGKTTLARALARSISTKFQRIQFTPDLLPGDLIGVSVYNQGNQNFEFHPGPIFSGILLADEINRTPPRTQSALLEAMAEYTVTTDGTTRKLPEPFMVLATQNPIEFGGTYPLPEAQLDRFLLRIDIGYPNRANEKKLLQQGRSGAEPDLLKPVMTVEDVRELQKLTNQVRYEESLIDYTLDLVEKTRTHKKLLLGASPRAALMLQRAARAHALIDEREFVVPEDIKAMLKPVMVHRLVARGMGAGLTGEDQIEEILTEIMNDVAVPQ